MIEPKPYRLINQIQNYDWGTRNQDAFILKLLNMEAEPNLPYAELWIGAHSKAPSKIEINGELISLDKLIDEYPNEILGKVHSEKFGGKLPFLLKILSSEKALSIQAHPDKLLAEKLHNIDPVNYPDKNHKPEIAIAIDYLNAVVGFKPFDEFVNVIMKYSSLSELIKTENTNKNELIKKYYSVLMNLTSPEIKTIIDQLLEQIRITEIKLPEEKVFLEQYENFGYDIGLISILLLNYVELKKDEAIFTGSGVPHAYIKGNIVECMANSDNVVRAGLTPKFKDVNTLINMLYYEGEKTEVIKPVDGDSITKYLVPVDEFEVTKLNLIPDESITIENISIIIGIVLKGTLQINCGHAQETFQKGESFLIPANVQIINFVSYEYGEVIFVTIP